MFKLVIQDDEGKTTVVPLIRDEITIGRKEGNTIRLTERNVSRRHARILRNNGEVQIEDLGSYNGIRVNNARIAERVSLRISDQVQIGDYKLYLKAEGVEQVDDARTMPIERVEGPTTDSIPAQTPTVQLPAQAGAAAPAMASGTAQNRVVTGVSGVADTDPAGGRPVASAAQVAALTQPAGYGKLVCISSNFAGKEFDLTRPQMIIGRTDENDIVVNHRSISRNHAKVTRDPETQRYTISDLQSSNGVRVNGQDYGKVELRRGDTVDLGHVRLMYVEPGQDFVFARDAVIADVPEAGGKKSLLVAVVLAVIVLGGVGAFFALKGGGGGGNNGGDQGDHGGNLGSNSNRGSDIAMHPGSDGSQTGTNPNIVVEPIDAAPVKPADDVAQIRTECHEFQVEKKWTDLQSCADRLKAGDPNEAKELGVTVKKEMRNEAELGKIVDAINQGNLTQAKKLADGIDEDSVYKPQATAKYKAAEAKVIDEYKAQANKLKRDKKCPDLEAWQRQALAQGTAVADAIKGIKCDAVVVVTPPTDCSQSLTNAGDKKCLKQFCANHEGDSHCAPATVITPPTACDADALAAKAGEAIGAGSFVQAKQLVAQGVACKASAHLYELGFMAGCKAHDLATANKYYCRLSPSAQSSRVSICVREGITVDQLVCK